MRLSHALLSLVGLLSVGGSYALHRSSYPAGPPERPSLVSEAIKNNEPLYYFGVGSNMSRTKLENRSICGSKIHIIGMEPAVIPDHRLAFNMRGLPPLEPGMGSLEPLDAEDSEAVHSYENEECHGALILLSPEDYEKVFKSEGGGAGRFQGYEEIVVTAVPYDETKPPVRAVAFRAREHVRMKQDPAPSERYMEILREGAKELELKPCYQKWLADHPVQKNSPLVTRIAVNNLVFTITVGFRLKWRSLTKFQSWFLYKAYVPPTQTSVVRRTIGEAMTCLILIPGSLVGFWMKGFLQMTGKMSPMMKMFIGRYDSK